MGLLRTAGAFRNFVQHVGDGSGPTELWLRQVRRDEQPVVSMRCLSDGERFEVACEVYPVDRITIEPLLPGPYVFSSDREAEEFAEEAMLVFEYLGCDIVESHT